MLLTLQSRRAICCAAGVAAIAGAVVAKPFAPAAHAQGATTPATTRQMTPAQRQAAIKQAQERQAQVLKTQLGFTSAQITKYQAKQKQILSQYEPKLLALQKKYGANPPAEKQQAAMAEARPIIMKMSKEMQDALLAVATPAQKAKIQKAQQGPAGHGPGDGHNH